VLSGGNLTVGDLERRRWLALQAGIAAAVTPYALELYRRTVLTDALVAAVEWVPPAGPAWPWKLLGSYVGRAVPPASPQSRYGLRPFDGTTDVSLAGELVTAAALAVLLVGLVELRSPRIDRGSAPPLRPDIVLGAWLAVPLVGMIVVSWLVTPVLFDRYTAPAGVALVIVLALGLVRAARVGAPDPRNGTGTRRTLFAVA